MTFSELPLVQGDWRFERGLMLAFLAEASYAHSSDVEFVVEDDLGLKLRGEMTMDASTGFVAEGDAVVVLAYAGTNQLSDWLANLNFVGRDAPWGRVHKGFHDAFQSEARTASIAAQIAASSGKPLWITGHSLGGALAHIAGHVLVSEGIEAGVATFGQPRTMVTDADKLLESRLPLGYHRIVNGNDIVARVPPGFKHTGTHIQLGQRRRLFGLEGAADDPGDVVPLMTEAQFEDLQQQLRAMRKLARDSRTHRGDAGATEEAMDRSVEGLIPGLNDHRLGSYISELQRLAGPSGDAAVFDGLLKRNAPSAAARTRRSPGGDVSGDVFGAAGPTAVSDADEEDLFSDAPSDEMRLRGGGPTFLEAVEEEIAPAGAHFVPVLAQLRDLNWQPEAGMKVLARTGDFVSALVLPEQVAAMEKDARIQSVEISRPGGMPDLESSMPFVNGRPVDRGPQKDELGANALVGIIDTGVDVLHDAFAGADGKTRIVAIWDQLDPGGPSPKLVDPDLPYDFGTLHLAPDIDAMRAGTTNTPAWLRDPKGHGTHVAGIAAGQKTGSLPDGIAPAAKIAVVIPDMETISGNPASLGYSVSHKSALEFLKDLGTKPNKLLPDAMPVSINVSLGMNAGAHDGQTLLEAAFDGTTGQGRQPGVVVVKSAGNERPHRGHAHVDVALGRVDIDWVSKDIERSLDYFEAWYFKLDILEFVLHSPGGDATSVVSKSARAFDGVLEGNEVQMRLRPRHPDNGENVLYIAVRPEAQSIQPGVWTLEVRGKRISGDSTGLHIWVERANARPVEFDNASQKMTLSVPGTANHIITVGATSIADEFPGVIRASSYGPTRDKRPKPELCAPGRKIVSARSNQADRSSAIAKTGTSMAAPHVAGAVALALSRRVAQGRSQFNTEQISTLLVASTQFTSTLHHHGFGYGILDISAFLDLCDEEP